MYYNPRKKILRGALTNGHDWIFLLLKFNNDDDGASYSQSDVIQMYVTRSRNDPPVVRHPEPDMIAAILLHWVSPILIPMMLNCQLTGLRC
jgi:hypothetical protein